MSQTASRPTAGQSYGAHHSAQSSPFVRAEALVVPPQQQSKIGGSSYIYGFGSYSQSSGVSHPLTATAASSPATTTTTTHSVQSPFASSHVSAATPYRYQHNHSSDAVGPLVGGLPPPASASSQWLSAVLRTPAGAPPRSASASYHHHHRDEYMYPQNSHHEQQQRQQRRRPSEAVSASASAASDVSAVVASDTVSRIEGIERRLLQCREHVHRASAAGTADSASLSLSLSAASASAAATPLNTSAASASSSMAAAAARHAGRSGGITSNNPRHGGGGGAGGGTTLAASDYYLNERDAAAAKNSAAAATDGLVGRLEAIVSRLETSSSSAGAARSAPVRGGAPQSGAVSAAEEGLTYLNNSRFSSAAHTATSSGAATVGDGDGLVNRSGTLGPHAAAAAAAVGLAHASLYTDYGAKNSDNTAVSSYMYTSGSTPHRHHRREVAHRHNTYSPTTVISPPPAAIRTVSDAIIGGEAWEGHLARYGELLLQQSFSEKSALLQQRDGGGGKGSGAVVDNITLSGRRGREKRRKSDGNKREHMSKRRHDGHGRSEGGSSRGVAFSSSSDSYSSPSSSSSSSSSSAKRAHRRRRRDRHAMDSPSQSAKQMKGQPTKGEQQEGYPYHPAVEPPAFPPPRPLTKPPAVTTVNQSTSSSSQHHHNRSTSQSYLSHAVPTGPTATTTNGAHLPSSSSSSVVQSRMRIVLAEQKGLLSRLEGQSPALQRLIALETERLRNLAAAQREREAAEAVAAAADALRAAAADAERSMADMGEGDGTTSHGVLRREGREEKKRQGAAAASSSFDPHPRHGNEAGRGRRHSQSTATAGSEAGERRRARSERHRRSRRRSDSSRDSKEDRHNGRRRGKTTESNRRGSSRSRRRTRDHHSSSDRSSAYSRSSSPSHSSLSQYTSSYESSSDVVPRRSSSPQDHRRRGMTPARRSRQDGGGANASGPLEHNRRDVARGHSKHRDTRDESKNRSSSRRHAEVSFDVEGTSRHHHQSQSRSSRHRGERREEETDLSATAAFSPILRSSEENGQRAHDGVAAVAGGIDDASSIRLHTGAGPHNGEGPLAGVAHPTAGAGGHHPMHGGFISSAAALQTQQQQPAVEANGVAVVSPSLAELLLDRLHSGAERRAERDSEALRQALGLATALLTTQQQQQQQQVQSSSTKKEDRRRTSPSPVASVSVAPSVARGGPSEVRAISPPSPPSTDSDSSSSTSSSDNRRSRSPNLSPQPAAATYTGAGGVPSKGQQTDGGAHDEDAMPRQRSSSSKGGAMVGVPPLSPKVRSASGAGGRSREATGGDRFADDVTSDAPPSPAPLTAAESSHLVALAEEARRLREEQQRLLSSSQADEIAALRRERDRLLLLSSASSANDSNANNHDSTNNRDSDEKRGAAAAAATASLAAALAAQQQRHYEHSERAASRQHELLLLHQQQSQRAHESLAEAHHSIVMMQREQQQQSAAAGEAVTSVLQQSIAAITAAVSSAASAHPSAAHHHVSSAAHSDQRRGSASVFDAVQPQPLQQQSERNGPSTTAAVADSYVDASSIAPVVPSRRGSLLASATNTHNHHHPLTSSPLAEQRAAHEAALDAAAVLRAREQEALDAHLSEQKARYEAQLGAVMALQREHAAALSDALGAHHRSSLLMTFSSAAAEREAAARLSSKASRQHAMTGSSSDVYREGGDDVYREADDSFHAMPTTTAVMSPRHYSDPNNASNWNVDTKKYSKEEEKKKAKHRNPADSSLRQLVKTVVNADGEQQQQQSSPQRDRHPSPSHHQESGGVANDKKGDRAQTQQPHNSGSEAQQKQNSSRVSAQPLLASYSGTLLSTAVPAHMSVGGRGSGAPIVAAQPHHSSSSSRIVADEGNIFYSERENVLRAQLLEMQRLHRAQQERLLQQRARRQPSPGEEEEQYNGKMADRLTSPPRPQRSSSSAISNMGPPASTTVDTAATITADSQEDDVYSSSAAVSVHRKAEQEDSIENSNAINSSSNVSRQQQKRDSSVVGGATNTINNSVSVATTARSDTKAAMDWVARCSRNPSIVGRREAALSSVTGTTAAQSRSNSRIVAQTSPARVSSIAGKDRPKGGAHAVRSAPSSPAQGRPTSSRGASPTAAQRQRRNSPEAIAAAVAAVTAKRLRAHSGPTNRNPTAPKANSGVSAKNMRGDAVTTMGRGANSTSLLKAAKAKGPRSASAAAVVDRIADQLVDEYKAQRGLLREREKEKEKEAAKAQKAKTKRSTSGDRKGLAPSATSVATEVNTEEGRRLFAPPPPLQPDALRAGHSTTVGGFGHHRSSSDLYHNGSSLVAAQRLSLPATGGGEYHAYGNPSAVVSASPHRHRTASAPLPIMGSRLSSSSSAVAGGLASHHSNSHDVSQSHSRHSVHLHHHCGGKYEGDSNSFHPNNASNNRSFASSNVSPVWPPLGRTPIPMPMGAMPPARWPSSTGGDGGGGANNSRRDLSPTRRPQQVINNESSDSYFDDVARLPTTNSRAENDNESGQAGRETETASSVATSDIPAAAPFTVAASPSYQQPTANSLERSGLKYQVEFVAMTKIAALEREREEKEKAKKKAKAAADAKKASEEKKKEEEERRQKRAAAQRGELRDVSPPRPQNNTSRSAAAQHSPPSFASANSSSYAAINSALGSLGGGGGMLSRPPAADGTPSFVSTSSPSRHSPSSPHRNPHVHQQCQSPVCGYFGLR